MCAYKLSLPEAFVVICNETRVRMCPVGTTKVVGSVKDRCAGPRDLSEDLEYRYIPGTHERINQEVVSIPIAV